MMELEEKKPPDETIFSNKKKKDMMKLKEKELLVFEENKNEAEPNGRLNYNDKVLRFLKNNIKAELKDVMKLKEKK